jgi:hypothetical protein
MFQSIYHAEMHKSRILSQKHLQNQTVMAKTLSEAKENIWTDIIKSMEEICSFIQIIFEQNEVVQKAKEAIEKIREELGERPREVTKLIKFLNSKNKQEL